MSESLADKIRRLLLEKGMTKYRLAEKLGRQQSYVEKLISGTIEFPRGDSLIKLAKAFDKPVDYFLPNTPEVEAGTGSAKRESPEDLLEKLRLATPISVPVYTEFSLHAGAGVAPVDYIYLSRTKTATKNIQAFIVHGDCLTPYIEDGDTVIVDRDLAPENGDLVICFTEDEFYIARYKIEENEAYLQNRYGTRKLEDCRTNAVVIEVIKKTRKNYRWSSDY